MGEPLDLRGPVFLAALALLALDALVVFFLAGGFAQLFRGRPRRAAAAVLALVAAGGLLMAATQASAQQRPPQQQRATTTPPADQSADAFAMRATIETRLAYVVDRRRRGRQHQPGRACRASRVFLAQRTALEAGEPVGARHRARRAVVLPADLLAGGAGRGEAVARRRWPASTPT